MARVKQFHDYLYGRSFTLITDHKPLLGILAGNRQTPIILSPRMTRWVVFLVAYNYELVYRPSKAMGHADVLSRCPLPALVEDPALHRLFFSLTTRSLQCRPPMLHGTPLKIVSFARWWTG